VIIQGSVAVVTGASRGFGAATAKLLARRGATVALLARTTATLDDVDREITTAGGRARAYTVDLSDALAVERTFARICNELGEPAILVNNAGGGAFQFLDEGTSADATAMIAVPYLAAVYATRAVLPGMRRRNRGHIVNVTSAAALRPIAGATAYNAACWAMRGLTEALRVDLCGTHVGVTLLAAGTSTTPGYDHYPGVVERIPRVMRIVPLLTPDVVARSIVRAIERERAVVIVPRTLRVLAAIDRIAPWLVRLLVARTGFTYRRSYGTGSDKSLRR
jgi:uncharacterized protein